MANEVHPQPDPDPAAAAIAGVDDTGPVTAIAATWYRVSRYLMVLMVLIFGLWFIKDGFYTWPQEQAENMPAIATGQTPPHPVHTDRDIGLNRILGLALPPLALVILIWARYNSRGAYSLDGTTLSVPGHPPVDLSQIQRIDDKLWDKKGIAYFYYPAADGDRKIRLDDFIYERPPTDEIYRRVSAYVQGEPAENWDDEPAESVEPTAPPALPQRPAPARAVPPRPRSN